MSLCSRVIAVLCALLLGCGAEEADAPDWPGPRDRLEIEGKSEVPVLPGRDVTLEVRLLDAGGMPLSGHTVEFDLSDTLSGASLAPAQVATDTRGHASAKLRAGMSNATFSVRVTAEGAEAVSFQINVGEAVEPTARVKVSYDGPRDVLSASLTLVPDATCAEVAEMGAGSNAASQVIYDFDIVVEFDDLRPDVPYALSAAGRDDTNGKLAASCTEFKAPVTADPDEALLDLEVTLSDVELELGAGYAVSLSVDLQKPLALLATAASGAVLAALPTEYPATRGASFYLDAVEAQLAPVQASEFAAQRPALDQALHMLLEGSQSGPSRLASELSALITGLGPSCSVQGFFDLEEGGRFSVDRVFALPSPALGAAAKNIELGGGALSGAVTLDASYDESSATLQIKSLSLQLGLGSYASVLLDGARADAASFAARLAAVHGCASVGSLVSSRTLPVTAVAAVAACEQAAASLVGRIDTAWQALDATHPSLWLSGSLAVHDRDETGVVDDLGPSMLHGSWSSTQVGAAAESVAATLRVPAPSALVAL
jgi:hypothetical protein